MSSEEKAPVIIKKVKKGGGEGHHGGAWKVAYADFVTAMMAFFLLMWLLNANTEKQRKGVADYFSPTIPINRISGGGDGSFSGDSVQSEETLSQNGIGGLPTTPSTSESQADVGQGGIDANEASQSLKEVEDILLGRNGESMVSTEALRHIITRVTDEGLIVELFDLPGDPLFLRDSDQPLPVFVELIDMITKVFSLVNNKLAIEAHVATPPLVLANNQVWEISGSRATQTRKMMENLGFEPKRINRVTGHADRQPNDENLVKVQNNRIELILLRP
ncbi:hypothetical protein N9Z23_03120 [Akkermansiaceae bacterium]|nr:hypothetical protein [Akkermansiaceae bacterium]